VGCGPLQRVDRSCTTAATASVDDIAVCPTDPSVERLSTVAHDVPTGPLDIANVQVDRIVEELRRIAASGRLITIEDVAMQQPRAMVLTSSNNRRGPRATAHRRTNYSG
jgi:hypothetical protein